MTILGPPSQDIQDAAAGGSGGGGVGEFTKVWWSPCRAGGFRVRCISDEKTENSIISPEDIGERYLTTSLYEQVQDTFMPDRRPGSRGQRYFSDYQFVPHSKYTN